MIYLALIFGFMALALAIAAIAWPRIFPDHSRDFIEAELRERIQKLERTTEEHYALVNARFDSRDLMLAGLREQIEKLPRPAPAEAAHQGYVEIERVNHAGEWEHDHWVKENSDAKQRAWNEPGLRLKYRGGRIDEGNQI